MKKRIVGACVLAGGIALTGLAGSAYAQGGSPATPAKAAAKAKGRVAIACFGTSGHINGKPDKPGKVAIELPRDVKHPVPPGKPKIVVHGGTTKIPAREKGLVTSKVESGGSGKIKIVTPPKGMHCSQVKPGTPGAPPPLPSR